MSILVNHYLVVNFSKKEYLCVGTKSLFSSQEVFKSNSTLIKTIEKLLYIGGDWFNDKIGLIANSSHHTFHSSALAYFHFEKTIISDIRTLSEGMNQIELLTIIKNTFKKKHVLPRLVKNKKARFLINDTKNKYIDLFSIPKAGNDFLDGDYFIHPLSLYSASHVDWMHDFGFSIQETIKLSRKYESNWLTDNIYLSDILPYGYEEFEIMEDINVKIA